MPGKSSRPSLSPLESDVMRVVWSRERTTADEVRQALQASRELKDSTVRTLLRRLEAKGYVEHDVDGRTYIYRPRIEEQHVATQQVRGIVDRFCSGSIENMLVGLVDDNLISPDALRDLANRIDEAERQQTKAAKRKK
ncbi:MAG: BlaI/MecI/CopY family transcriptional regulator [Planctomycetaceae bacterium]|nr:BlaI/MecI/CopY family transcriptional regulator [Planctomycetaceae bacterium]